MSGSKHAPALYDGCTDLVPVSNKKKSSTPRPDVHCFGVFTRAGNLLAFRQKQISQVRGEDRRSPVNRVDL